MRAKFFTILKEIHVLQGGKHHDIKVEIEEGNDCLEIKPKGYGDYDSADGFGVPIVLENYEGHLRLIFWPDINKEHPTIIDMEGAREEARKDEK